MEKLDREPALHMELVNREQTSPDRGAKMAPTSEAVIGLPPYRHASLLGERSFT